MAKEQIQELSKKTLRSYVKKAEPKEYKLGKKVDAEEDKAMSTDGTKYPAKQKKHQDNANALGRPLKNKIVGIDRAKKKLKEDNNLLGLAHDQKPLEFEKGFADAMLDRIHALVAAKRVEVASAFLQPKEAE